MCFFFLRFYVVEVGGALTLQILEGLYAIFKSAHAYVPVYIVVPQLAHDTIF